MPAEPHPIVNLNGDLLPAGEARISIFDHGLLYGDGLFETIAVHSGRLFRTEAHLRRLRAGASQIGLDTPWSMDELTEALHATVQANVLQQGAARLTVTRGEGPPVPDPSRCASPQFFITVRTVTPRSDEEWERGTSACVAGRHPLMTVPGVKTLSCFPFQQARETARRRGFDDGLLVDGEYVVEASTSNVFAVREGTLVTPDLESGCLPGIARMTVLEVAQQTGIPVCERSLPLEWLASCDELFLTNSLVQVLPVVRTEDGAVGEGCPGPLTRRLRDAYRRLVQRERAALDREEAGPLDAEHEAR